MNKKTVLLLFAAVTLFGGIKKEALSGKRGYQGRPKPFAQRNRYKKSTQKKWAKRKNNSKFLRKIAKRKLLLELNKESSRKNVCQQQNLTPKEIPSTSRKDRRKQKRNEQKTRDKKAKAARRALNKQQHPRKYNKKRIKRLNKMQRKAIKKPKRAYLTTKHESNPPPSFSSRKKILLGTLLVGGSSLLYKYAQEIGQATEKLVRAIRTRAVQIRKRFLRREKKSA